MPDYTTIPIPIATNGLNKDLQPTQIPSASPNMMNMKVENWGVRKRLGYSTKGINLPLPGIGMELIQYTDARGTIHQLACTTTSVYLYDSDSNQWLNICPPTTIEDCEDDWVTGAGADSSAAQSDVKKVGTYALKIEVKTNVADGDILCYEDIATTDITTHNIISFWVRSTGALSAGSIEIVLTEAELGAKTGTITTDYIEITNPIAMVVDTWYNFSVALTDTRITTSLNAIESVAVYSNHATELDGVDIYIDDIKVTTGFTGSADNRWSHGIVHDSNKFTGNGGTALVLSNNVDKPYYYEGDSGDVLARLTAIDGIVLFAHTKEVIEFWNHFFVINYNTGSTNVRSLLYADLGDIDDWATGTSGGNVLTDSVGKLLRAKKLGSEMIIYSENSITTCRYFGGLAIFTFPTLVFETGLFSEKAIWDFVNIHYFIGTDQKIYGYSGGQQLLPIGNAIEESLFEALDISKKEKIVVGLDPSRHKLYFFFPTSSDTYSSRAYAYNYKQTPATWEYHEFANTVRDFSIFNNKAGWYADGDELELTYADETTFYADTSYTQLGFPTAVVLSHDGYIFELNESVGLDNATNINCEYETMDITLDNEEHYFRTSWLSFNAMSTKVTATVNLYYSVDGGINWTTLETDYSISTALANTWTQHRIPIDINDRIVRFKFTQDSSKDFQLRSMHIKIEQQTDKE